ncbi:MAG: carbonic anhydrase [Sphingomonas sp.]|nr:carbonic anhydrase [Sphingomonas sp.]
MSNFPALSVAALMPALLTLGAAPSPIHSAPAAQSPRPTVAGEGTRAEWGYVGPTGPDHWSELSKSYAICNSGNQESPVDLKDAIEAGLGTIAFDWKPQPLKATNNGHTVEFEAASGSSIGVGRRRYALSQFHIHHPSEHLLAGRRFPLEIHFVHTLPDGTIGVVGVFVTQGAANPVVQSLLDTIPMTSGDTRAGGTIDINRLLPRARDFYRYEGSLTTPPCAEKVDWIVLGQPIAASAGQIARFQAIFPFNARPLQPLYRRFLLHGR